MPRFLLIICLLSLCLAGGWAETDIDPVPLDAIALNWAREIDSGAYAASYAEGGSALHEKVPADRWSLILKTIRKPLGSVKSRKVSKHTYYPDGYEGAPGEFMAIGFETSFENTETYLENIVLKREDGHWRPAGYNAGPKAAQANP